MKWQQKAGGKNREGIFLGKGENLEGLVHYDENLN